MTDTKDSLTRALRQIYGMAHQGIDASNAAARWCERIDEVCHRGWQDEYTDCEEPLPDVLEVAISALIAEAVEAAAQRGFDAAYHKIRDYEEADLVAHKVAAAIRSTQQEGQSHE